MRELILVYQTQEPLLALLRQVTEPNGFVLKMAEDPGEPIGVTAGVLPPAMARTAGLPPAGPMLVLCGMSDERLDRFLDVLRSAGLRFPFKAVLTKTNQHWLPGELFAHMLAERAEIQRQMEENKRRG